MTTAALVASVQFEMGPLSSVEEYWEKVTAHVQEAHERGVKLLVFPEYQTANLLALQPLMNYPDACAYLASHTDEYIARFSQYAHETGMTILGGTHIVREGNGFANQAFLFYPDGRIETQKKVHTTPEERNVWDLIPGDSFQVFDTEIGRVAILTCYEIEFPETARIVADMGAEIILCPSYTDAAAGFYRVRYTCQARAIENQLFVVMSGLCGEVPGIEQIDIAYTQAGIFAPCDRPFPPHGILAEGALNQNGQTAALLDLAQLRENRTNGAVAPYYDRKPDVYAKYQAQVQDV